MRDGGIVVMRFMLSDGDFEEYGCQERKHQSLNESHEELHGKKRYRCEIRNKIRDDGR